MKTSILTVLGCLSLFVAVAQTPAKHFYFTPEKATPGQTISITYDAAATVLKGKTDIHAIAYEYNSYQWQTLDIPIKATGQIWQGSIKTPEDCGFVAFKFVSGDVADNDNDMVYCAMLVDGKQPGQNAAGALAGWGLLRSPKFGYGVPGYMKSFNISDTATYYWLSQEISFHHTPQAQAALVVPYAKSAHQYMGEAAMPKINAALGFLEKSGTEENLLKARAIYQTVLYQKNKADSLDAQMLKLFPKGSIARLNAYKQVFNERDLNKKLALSEQFLVDYPQAGTNAAFDLENRISYGTVYEGIILISAYNKNLSVINKYINLLPYASLNNIYYKIVQIAHDRKDQTDATLYPYAKALVTRIEAYKNNKPAEYWYLSPMEWQQQVEKNMAISVLTTQVNLLKNVGEFDVALQYAQQAQLYLKYKRANLNYDEVLLLQKKNLNDKVNEVLIKSMYENQSTPEMMDMLKTSYIKQYKTADGFDKYLESLKNAALSVAATKQAEMVKKDFPDWAMYDIHNKLVRFKDLRGKTIVMDFWATWCVPCKASFPGMKLAVEKYKNDPNVVFYFVDTEERTADYKAQVAKFIKENNYPFNILFDNKVKGGNITDEVYTSMCKAFGISGIPQKLIIDKNGKLRFIAVGYNGSASALADEISAMVELTKKAD